MRVSDCQRRRWFAEADRQGTSLTDLIKTAVDAAVAAGQPATSPVDADGAVVSVTHGSNIVVMSIVRVGVLNAWVGTPSAARAVAVMLIRQAAQAELAF